MTDPRESLCADDVIVTHELDIRPSRAPDHESESGALGDLAETMAIRPNDVLQRLVEAAMALTRADSAGISLLEPGGEQGPFRWVATAGAWAPYRDGTMPREASPCGEVIAREAVLLVSHPERAFPALLQANPGIGEGLLAPFHVDGAPVGTVWVIKHDQQGRFDAEDARLLQSLSRFAAAAHQMVAALKGAKAGRRESDNRLALAVEIGKIGHWELSLATGELTTSASCRRNFGRPEDAQFSYDELIASIHPEDRERQQRTIEAAVEAKSGFELEYRIVTPQAEMRWTQIRGRYEDGDNPRIVGVSQDITERKRAEEVLRTSEERQAFLLKLSDALRPLSDSNEVMAAASEALGRHLEVGRCGYGEVDATGEFFTVGHDWTDGRMASFSGRHHLVDFGPEFAAAYRAGRSVLIDDALADARARGAEAAFEAAGGVRASLGVPMIKDGRFVAGLFAQQTLPRHWSAGEEVLVHEVAERTWAAVQRARAEAALRESQARLAAAFESVPVGAAVVDMSGAAVIANADYRRFLPTGIVPSRDPVRGARWQAWDLQGLPLSPQDFPAARAMRGESVVPGQEMLYTDDDGREIWTNVATVPTRDDRGQVTGLVTAIADINTAKRSSDALRESEERFRHFGEATQDVLWIRDAETFQWEYLTPAFETIYGLDREAALRGDNMMGWLHLILPEDREHAAASLSRVRQGEWVTFEYRVRRPIDGQIRWLRNTDFPIKDGSGKVVRIGGIGHDITELKRSEEALAALEVRQRTLMEGIPQLVWRACDEGLWTWASPQWLDFTGQSQEGSHGLGWLDVIHPDDRPATERAWQAARKHGMLDAEYRVRRAADGAWVWHHTRSVPVRDSQGRIVEWLGTSTDIQKLRELQDQQDVLVAELQHRTRNLMGVVRSTADKTARASADLPDFRARFRDRLEALSRVQGLLSRLKEHDRVTFDQLIEAELAAMDGAADQISLSGPRGVRLRSSMVQTLAMALHELATNAVKYGALGQPQGRLALTWSLEPNGPGKRSWLRIDWRESGVTMPPAGSKPTGGGQGRELIERALPYQLSAKTSYELGPDGVRCTISVPVSTSDSSWESENG